MHTRAGTFATAADLVAIPALIAAYYERIPNPDVAEERVAFGTSGHRGSALRDTFTASHILATTQAIVEYRAAQGVSGPLFLGADTHALSGPALQSALEVLVANGVQVLIDASDGFVPTPAISHAIIRWNADPARAASGLADGIVVTPSHNPPTDGGFKYNPPHGGPADTDATGWIAARANALLAADPAALPGVQRVFGVPRVTVPAEPTGWPCAAALAAAPTVGRYDFMGEYVRDLANVIDMEAIRASGSRIGADPLGGASVAYWRAIRETYGLNLTVVNETVDPTWAFMTLDWDGNIRMDPSSPSAMASVVRHGGEFDVLVANDADADRHGIVTPDGGLMNPNHFLAVAIDYLYAHRPGWRADAAVGKTLVSSSMIDRVAGALGRRLLEVPVGFKWFVPGLRDGSVAFGGEESAGASFLRRDGGTWTTDKDGILLCLLAAEIRAVTGESPSERYRTLAERFGAPAYARVDAPATPAEKTALGTLDGEAIRATALAGDPIVARISRALGNNAPLGGVKVATETAWFAARPSGTEDVVKVYAESFRGPAHLAEVQADAARLIRDALNP